MIFLDETECCIKLGLRLHETAALSNGTPGIMQGMKTYMLQTDDGCKIFRRFMSLGAGIQLTFQCRSTSLLS